MYLRDEEAEKPQSYRIATYVEEPDPRYDSLGYGLAIPRVQPIATTFGGYTVGSVFYTVNRDTCDVVGDPTIYTLSTDDDVAMGIDSVKEAYTKQELAFALSLLNKMRMCVLDTTYGSDMDSKVATGIILHDSDTLYRLRDMSAPLPPNL